MKGWDENQLERPWNWNGIQMRPLFSALIWYLKGSIQALDPQLVHVGVGNVIDQLHLDSVITSERSSKRASAPRDQSCTGPTLFASLRCAMPFISELLRSNA
jgi:hypothetical protein